MNRSQSLMATTAVAAERPKIAAIAQAMGRKRRKKTSSTGAKESFLKRHGMEYEEKYLWD
jgi:hypothetical protein